LATEGVGTYKVLSRFGLRPNLIFLADHGFGANWNPNLWGEPTNNSDKISFLKNNTTIETGGYHIFDGTYKHLLQIPEELAELIIILKKYDKYSFLAIPLTTKERKGTWYS
jgi:hypothetical protein